jgi:glycosyltransferase involved in cell wall biosynthesis
VPRVLFLSYHFPPVGGAGVQRAARFARLLPSFGYQPVCVAGPGEARSRWAPEDQSLLGEIPAETEVHRLGGPEPAPLEGWRIPAQRWLRLREPWSKWWVNGAVGLAELAGTTDLIYAWMQPYDSAEAASELSRRSGRPWVADLGDPWALDEMMVYPTAAHRGRERRSMRKHLGTASAIIMSTPEAAARVLAAFPELDDRPVVAIPNGFDPLDFAGEPPSRSDAAFRIVHTGYLHTQLGRQMRRRSVVRRLLGGDVRGVDIYTRSHAFLIEALELLLREDAAAAGRIELHLAGVMSPDDREVAARSSLVREHGFLSHRASVDLMRSADLLFLPMHDLPDGMRATIVPGKTYEYLASRRPILAAVPDGDARDLLLAAGSAVLTRPDDVDALAEAVRELATGERLVAGPPDEVVERYSYARLAGEVARIFDAVLDGGARLPAAVAGRVA